jgi:bacillithiol system protein YtxJ
MIPLTSDEQLEALAAAIGDRVQFIFKHSTRCPVSGAALKRIENIEEQLSKLSDVYYLDLLRYRQLSNRVSTMFGVVHQSPQMLLIKEGRCLYHASHSGIRPDTLLTALTQHVKTTR